VTTDPTTSQVLVARDDLVDTLAARLAEGWRLALTSAREVDDRIRATHDVRVQMRYFLLPDATSVDDDAKAVRTTLSYRNFIGFGQNFTEH